MLWVLIVTFFGMLATFAFHVVGLCVLAAVLCGLALFWGKRKTDSMSAKTYRLRVLGLAVSAVVMCLIARAVLWGNDFATGYAVPEGLNDVERVSYEMTQTVMYWARLIWTYALISVPFIFVWLLDSVKRLRDMGQNVTRVWLLLVPIRNIFFFYDLLVDPTRDQRFDG